MVYTYRNDLLAPYLALDQGEKVQAECMSTPKSAYTDPKIHPSFQTSGSMVTAVSVPRPLCVSSPKHSCAPTLTKDLNYIDCQQEGD